MGGDLWSSSWSVFGVWIWSFFGDDTFERGADSDWISWWFWFFFLRLVDDGARWMSYFPAMSSSWDVDFPGFFFVFWAMFDRWFVFVFGSFHVPEV